MNNDTDKDVCRYRLTFDSYNLLHAWTLHPSDRLEYRADCQKSGDTSTRKIAYEWLRGMSPKGYLHHRCIHCERKVRVMYEQ